MPAKNRSDDRHLFFNNKSDINCYYISDIFSLPTPIVNLILIIKGEKRMLEIIGPSLDASAYFSIGDCFSFLGFFTVALIAIMNILRW